MLPEKYRLAAVGRFLLEQFELRRPGIREWSPQIEASLRQDAESELQLMEKQVREIGIDDATYWQRVRRALDEILLPRYAALATGEIELAKRDYGIWRGGDLVARATFALAGFILGIICVEVPYIPIQAKRFPARALVSRRRDVAPPPAVAEKARGAGRRSPPRQRDAGDLPPDVRADARAGNTFRARGGAARRGAREGLTWTST